MKNPGTVFITGATSGIGAAFARHFAGRGYGLVLTGRRREKLSALAEELREKHKVRVAVEIAELTRQKDVDRIARLIGSCGDLEALVNNAGYGHGKSFGEDTLKAQSDMALVHNLAVLALTHAAVRVMKKRRRGAVVNVSSLGGFVASPSSALYSATKAFLTVFSESLYMELKPFGIRVQALCPGYTWTDFHEKIGISRDKQKNRGLFTWMSADAVVRESVRQLEKDNPVCIPGFWNRLLYGLIRIVPKPLYYRMAAVKKMRR
jgi:short-subunit dehydrogenase